MRNTTTTVCASIGGQNTVVLVVVFITSKTISSSATTTATTTATQFVGIGHCSSDSRLDRRGTPANQLRYADRDESKRSVSLALGCQNLAMAVEFDDLTGLSSVNIPYIDVTDGTQIIDDQTDCDGVTGRKWKTAAFMEVRFQDNLVAPRVRAAVIGNCQGKSYNQPLSVSVQAVGASFAGSANIRGVFGGTLGDSIDAAEVLGTLRLATASIPVTVSLLPAELSPLLNTVTTQLEAAFRSQLVKDIEPLVRKKLELTIPSGLWNTAKVFVVETFVETLPLVTNLVAPLLEGLEDLYGDWLGGGGGGEKGGNGGNDDDGDDDDDQYYYDDDF